MIRQEVTYYPNTFKTKEYKEYLNDVLNIHTKYDENNNRVYTYLAYEDLEWFRMFEVGTTNSDGDIIYYKDNKGSFKFIDGELTYSIQESFNEPNAFMVKIKNHVGLILNASCIFKQGVYYCYQFVEHLPDSYRIRYDAKYSRDILLERGIWNNGNDYVSYIDNRGHIITFDELMELSNFKDFLLEHKILPAFKKI